MQKYRENFSDDTKSNDTQHQCMKQKQNCKPAQATLQSNHLQPQIYQQQDKACAYTEITQFH